MESRDGSASPAESALPVSPLHTMLVLVGAAFLTEFLLMLMLDELGENVRRGVTGALLDSVGLVALLAPLFWWLIVRPLRRLGIERGELFLRLLSIQDEERARVARNLHDDVGQSQTALLLGLRNLRQAASLEQARGHAERLSELAHLAIDATRRLARDLSPILLVDLGLAPAIERLCEDLSATVGVRVQPAVELGPRRLPPAVELAAYRLVQEAVTNALKHASASQIVVSVSRRGDRLRVTVSDDGVGLPQSDSETGLGLRFMRQRVELLGGRWSRRSSVPNGTEIRAEFPLPNER